MPSVHLNNIGVSWDSNTPLFSSSSLHLERGFYGLVGANGAGKTTLLSVIAGLTPVSAGAVTLTPKGATLAYCQQVISIENDELHDFATRYDRQAIRLRSLLGLDPEMLESWASLSPGERKRWQVAAALGSRPEILLLDEPSNHLDAESQERVLNALSHFSGLAVLVSHDRAVLDTLTTATLRIHQGQLTLWPGSFSAAKALWDESHAELLSAYDEGKKRVQAAKARLATARRKHDAASRHTSTASRMRNKHDSDARGILAGNVASRGESKAGRGSARARDELRRAALALPSIERDATQGGRVFARFTRAPKAILFHLNEDRLQRGDRMVLRNVNVTIGREERVRIEGANGAGKTTLLKALVASQAQQERVLYLPQELSVSQVEDTLRQLSDLDPQARGEVFSIFAALGSDPKRLLGAKAGQLSPGEARKLLLAEALSRQVWALVLDEPTNHMDLPSVERLEELLATYPGALLFVTHDEPFAAQIASRSLHVEGGLVR